MIVLRNPGRTLFAVTGLLASFACADNLTSPAVDAPDSYSAIAGRAFARYGQGPISAEAILDGSGKTTVNVLLGQLPYFDEGTGTLIPTAPLPGYLRKVHVKFCKASRKELGIKQFGANFDYKSNDPVDKEPDDEPDSPLDPDDKARKQVNWDRSARHTTLDGGPGGSLEFTGIPEDAELELKVYYSTPETKSDGKVENKKHEVKFCIPITRAGDLGIIALNWPVGAALNVPTVFRSSVTALGAATSPSFTRCVAYVDNVQVAESGPVVVSPVIAPQCSIPITFTKPGPNAIRIQLENTSPADFNAANDGVSASINVAGGPGSTILGLVLASTIIETQVAINTDDVLKTYSNTLFNQVVSEQAFPKQMLQTLDQSSKAIVTFDRAFTGAVKLTVSQTTDGRLIHSQTHQFNTACSPPVSAVYPVAYRISFCGSPSANKTTLEYQTNANVDQSGSGTGTFIPYGSEITYSVTIVNQGKTYVFTHSVPIRVTKNGAVTPDGGVCEPPVGLTKLCHYGNTVLNRRDGDAGIISVSLSAQ